MSPQRVSRETTVLEEVSARDWNEHTVKKASQSHSCSYFILQNFPFPSRVKNMNLSIFRGLHIICVPSQSMHIEITTTWLLLVRLCCQGLVVYNCLDFSGLTVLWVTTEPVSPAPSHLLVTWQGVISNHFYTINSCSYNRMNKIPNKYNKYSGLLEATFSTYVKS